MKIKHLFIILLCAIFLVYGYVQSNRVVLRINGEEIRNKEFKKEYTKYRKKLKIYHSKIAYLEQRKEAQIKREYATSLIFRRLLEQEWKKLNITVSEKEVEERFELFKNGDTRDFSRMMLATNKIEKEKEKEIKESLERFIKLDKLLRAYKFEVSDYNVQIQYMVHRSKYLHPEKRRYSHILLKTNYSAVKKDIIEENNKKKISIDDINKIVEQKTLENEALLNKVLAKVNASNFANMAMIYSQDPESAPKGGDMGYFEKHELGKIIGEAVFSRDPGVVGSVVKTPQGSHIILVTERKPAHLTPLKEIEKKLKTDFYYENVNYMTAKLYEILASNSTIEYLDKTLQEDYKNFLEKLLSKLFKKETVETKWG